MRPENKVAFIGVAVTVLLQFLFFNTANFNLLAAGIYLGLAKDFGPQTNKVYYLLTVLFYVLNNLFLKGGLAEDGLVEGFFVALLGSLMLSAIPLGIAWIVRKVRKI